MAWESAGLTATGDRMVESRAILPTCPANGNRVRPSPGMHLSPFWPHYERAACSMNRGPPRTGACPTADPNHPKIPPFRGGKKSRGGLRWPICGEWNPSAILFSERSGTPLFGPLKPRSRQLAAGGSQRIDQTRLMHFDERLFGNCPQSQGAFLAKMRMCGTAVDKALPARKTPALVFECGRCEMRRVSLRRKARRRPKAPVSSGTLPT